MSLAFNELIKDMTARTLSGFAALEHMNGVRTCTVWATVVNRLLLDISEAAASTAE